jgi:hypothetical protein
MDEDDGALTDDSALTDDEGTTVVNNSRAETPIRPGIKTGTLYTQIKRGVFKLDTVSDKELHVQGLDPDSNRGT